MCHLLVLLKSLYLSNIWKGLLIRQKMKTKLLFFLIAWVITISPIASSTCANGIWQRVAYYAQDTASASRDFFDEVVVGSFPRSGREILSKTLKTVQQRVSPAAKKTWDFVRPRSTTNVLMAANILVWLGSIYCQSKYNSDILFNWGAKDNALISQGQIWRLITPMFLHANIAHLALNSYALHNLGPNVEKIYGKKKFIPIYLLAGIAGNIASFALLPYRSLGASGAICGLLGALVHFGIKYKDQIDFGHFKRSIAKAIVLNAAIGLLIPGIDNYTHAGGLIGGYLAARALL